MTVARHAVPQDRGAAVAALASAFSTDPIFTYLFDPAVAEVDATLMTEVMEIVYDTFVINGHTYVVDDLGAAVWSPPGITTDTEAMSAFFGERSIPDRMATALPGFIEMVEVHPTEPHFYLQFIGTHAAGRGRGVGSRLLDRVLSVCDTEGIPAYLEASTPRSAALYARHGFEPLTSIALAEGVELVPMLRPPRHQDERGDRC